MQATRRFLMLMVVAGFIVLPMGFAKFSAHAGSTGESVIGDAPKAPPAEPVYEVDAGERPGYVRSSGYWKWTGNNYMWMPSRWIKEQADSVWVENSWTQRGKKWHLTPGHWERDENAPEPAMELEANETAAALVETHETTADEPAPSMKAAVKKGTKAKNVKAKPAKKIDYQDTQDWPRIMHH